MPPFAVTLILQVGQVGNGEGWTPIQEGLGPFVSCQLNFGTFVSCQLSGC